MTQKEIQTLRFGNKKSITIIDASQLPLNDNNAFANLPSLSYKLSADGSKDHGVQAKSVARETRRNDVVDASRDHVTPRELDARLEAVEARMSERLASIEANSRILLTTMTAMREDVQGVKGEMSAIRASNSSVKSFVVGTGARAPARGAAQGCPYKKTGRPPWPRRAGPARSANLTPKRQRLRGREHLRFLKAPPGSRRRGSLK